MIKPIGVLVGRFQIHRLTDGHTFLFSQVASRSSRVLALLGVPPVSGRRRDPLEYALRARMLQDYWADAYPAGPELIVVPCLDCPTNELWATQIDRTIDALAPGQSAVFYCGADGCGPVYQGAHGKWPVEVLDAVPGHATAQRASLTPRHTEDFRAGVVYHSERRFVNPYPVVDVAVVNHEAEMLLLARKATDPPTRYRLIGGFVDCGETLEQAASREVREETGIEIGHLRYAGSGVIPDWRYRGTVEQILSSVFLADYVFGNPVAHDDISEVRWIALANAARVIHPNHAVLLEAVLRQLAQERTTHEDSVSTTHGLV